MKMRIVTVLMLTLALAVSANAYEKTVMVEYFSNYSCSPCFAQDDEVQAFLSNYSRDDAVFMVYHVNWPGANDWYYLRNTSEPLSRWSYYVSWTEGVPFFVADGLAWDNYINNVMGTISTRVGTYTPVEIVLDYAEFNANGNISVHVTVNSDVALTGHRLQACLTDIDCAFGAAPNGIQNYRYNMLDMNPNHAGTDLGSIEAGGSGQFEFEFIPWDSHELNNYSITLFVQNYSTKEVRQALYFEGVEINIPNLNVVNHYFDDTGEVLPNGRPDPGESVELIVTLENHEDFLATDNLIGTLSVDNDDIVISNNDVEYLTIQPGFALPNTNDPFVIEVPMGFAPEYVNFTVDFEDASGFTLSYDFIQLVGSPDVAIVDDSPAETDVHQWWFDIMMDSGITSDILTSTQATTADLSEYDAIVWATSNAVTDVLTASEISSIQTFLDQGGKVLLTGENIGEYAGTESLLQNYFGVTHELGEVGDEYEFLLYGVEDGPYSGSQIVTTGNGGANTSMTPGSMTPLAGSQPLFYYIMTDYIGATGYQGDGFATTYLAFNLESVSGLNNTWRGADVMWQLLDWMGATTAVENAPTPASLPTTVTLDSYPNPFNALMTVSYTLPRASEVQLNLVNVLGQTVSEVMSGRMMAGAHEVSADVSDLASGVYFLQLQAGSDVQMKKVVLLK